MNTDELLQKLDERGAAGLDLSPGDELCAQAAREIRRLRYELTEANEDAWKYRDLCT